MDNIPNLLIITAGIIWSIELIPQIIKTFKTKNVEGLSLIFFAMCTFAYILYETAFIMLGNWPVVFAYILSFLGNLVMCVLILKYRKRP